MNTIKTTTRKLLLITALGTSTLAAGASAPPVMDFSTWSYLPDQVGNIVSRDDGTDTTTYGYDVLDRLTQEYGPDHTDFYSYDANGNREDFTRDGQLLDYLIDAMSNRLDQVGTETRSYDAAGNTTADRSGARTFTYNDAGRLTQVHENGQLIASYTYNALGQRATKTTTSGTSYYLYDSGGQLLGEYDASGQPVKEYVHLNGEPLAQLDTQVTYLHTDHLGTPRRATDETGQVIWSWDSEAFGNAVPDQDPDNDGQATTVSLRFPGQQYDTETGFYYNYFRYYDPQTGRYITSDPIGLEGGINTYLYANANPTRYSDPRGLNPLAGCAAGAWGGPLGCGIGSLVGGGIILWMILSTPGDTVQDDLDSPEQCTDDESKDCSKASKYQLRKAGIPGPEYRDEHDFKDAWGATPNRFYDICACKDGSIVIRAQGQCGKSGPTIPTTESWK